MELADVAELYEAQFDFPRTTTEPRLHYLIATTQRSGSTLLALRLWRTGGLGAPLEYLKSDTIAELEKRLGAASHAGYWCALQGRRTSPNGVFGFKAFGSHIKECGRDRPQLVDICLPPDRVIYLTREDKDRQAISFARATQTNAWISGARPTAIASYDREFIAGCRRFIERQEIAWQRYFERLKIAPVFVTYESLIGDADRTTTRIAQALGVDLLDCAEVKLPALHRQSDELTQEWLQRFKTPVRTHR
jgi:LPS sulfotransferase NodH